MLAQLLRRAILAQGLIGAASGYYFVFYAHIGAWFVGLAAALLPLLTTVLANLATAVLSRTATEPAALWWRALWGEAVASIRIFLFRQPWTVAAPGFLPATSYPTQVPVVLVHGFVCNHRLWDDTIAALRARGHPVLAVNLEPLFTSIDHYADSIESVVDSLCRYTGAPKVALVGHSMGGLAIRAWMRAYGTRRVAKVLTLGTPHTGTRIGQYTHTPNGAQMAWHSPWLAELAATESRATRALMEIALTAQDDIVYPQREQVLRDVETTVFEGMGHLQMCLEKPVIQWVLTRLSGL